MESLPEKLEYLLTQAYGETAAEIINGCLLIRPVTFRVNTLKATADEIESALAAAGIALEKSAFKNAYIVSGARERELRETEV